MGYTAANINQHDGSFVWADWRGENRLHRRRARHAHRRWRRRYVVELHLLHLDLLHRLNLHLLDGHHLHLLDLKLVELNASEGETKGEDSERRDVCRECGGLQEALNTQAIMGRYFHTRA